MGTKRNIKTDFIGSFFHSFIPVPTDTELKKQLQWQGQVIGSPHPGFFLVQLFGWGMGEPTTQRLVKIEDMVFWHFYASAEDMREAHERMPMLTSDKNEHRKGVPC